MAVHDLIIRIGAQVSPGFQAGLKRAFSGLEGLLGGVAGGAVVGAPAFLAQQAFSRGKEIGDVYDTSRALGMDTTQLGNIQRASQIAGVAFDGVAQRLGKLTVEAEKNAEVYMRNGVAVYDATGKLRDANSIFGDLTAKLMAETDARKRATLAAELFGKRGFLDILKVIEELDRAKRSGMRITDAEGQAADEFGKNWNMIWMSIKDRSWITFGEAIMKATQAARWLTSIGPERKANGAPNQAFQDAGASNAEWRKSEGWGEYVEMERRRKDAARNAVAATTTAMDASGGW